MNWKIIEEGHPTKALASTPDGRFVLLVVAYVGAEEGYLLNAYEFEPEDGSQVRKLDIDAGPFRTVDDALTAGYHAAMGALGQ